MQRGSAVKKRTNNNPPPHCAVHNFLLTSPSCQPMLQRNNAALHNTPLHRSPPHGKRKRKHRNDQ